MLRYECGNVTDTTKGSRTWTLFQAARNVGEIVAGGECDEDRARHRLRCAAQCAGLTGRDLDRTLDNGFTVGLTEPRCAPHRGTMTRDAKEAVERILAWWDLIDATQWRGAHNATTVKILAGFTFKALACGKQRLALSYREIAELAGVSVATVHGHRVGGWDRWVQLVERGSQRTGRRSVWQLLTTRAYSNSSEATGPGGVTCSKMRAPVDPAHNYWHHWAGGWRLYDLLTGADGGCTPAQLAERLGYHVGHVRKMLNRLADEGLVERDDDGLWHRLDHVELPTSGLVDHRADRCARHRRDRERYERWRTLTPDLDADPHDVAPFDPHEEPQEEPPIEPPEDDDIRSAA